MTTDIDFDTPRAARRSIHRPCAVCQLPADMLLCRECADQSERSRALVRDWLHKNIIRANILMAQWDAIREPQQAAWEKIQDSLALDDYAARCARHRAAGNVYGKLLQALDEYEDALRPLDVERRRLEKALEVLSTL